MPKLVMDFTPLMQAVLVGHAHGVVTLIAAGADVNMVVTLKTCNDDIVKKKQEAMGVVFSYPFC